MIETTLLQKTHNVEYLFIVLQKTQLDEDDAENFLKNFKNFEFFYLCELICKNKDLLCNLQHAIKHYYFYNLSEKNPENLVALNIIKKLNKILPNQDNLEGFSYCIAVWLIVSFNEFNFKNIMVEDNKIWVNRYTIIYKLVEIYKNFNRKLDKIIEDFSEKVEENSEFEDLKNLMWTLLHICINSNLLAKQKKANLRYKKVSDSKKNNNTHKSNVFVALGTAADYYSNLNNLEIYLKPMEIQKIHNNYYVYNNHYLNIKPLIHKNKQNKKNSKIGDLSFIKLRAHMRMFINWDFFYFLKTLLFNHYKIDSQMDETNLNKMLNQAKKKIWLKSAQQEFNRIFSLAYFLKLEKIKPFLKNGFYFQYYFDFRGRVYADSPISYTNSLNFRYLYNYGVYDEVELKIFQKNTTTADVAFFPNILATSDIKNIFKNLDVNNIVVQKYTQTIFFEIGKVFKNKIITKLKGVITLANFIELGVEIFKKNCVKDEKIEDQIIYWSLIFIFKELNKNIFIKAPIFKDATASGPQILSLILGANSLEIYKKNNLLEKNVWYDTYYHLIQSYLQNNELPEDLKNKFFTRKNLKKTIMTFNYNATYLKCWDYFKEESGLPWSDHEEINKLIQPFFKKFYLYLKTIFESNYYYTNPSSIISEQILKWFNTRDELYFQTQDNFLIFLKYYLIEKNKRVDRKIKAICETRETIYWDKISSNEDVKKTTRSIQANIIHAWDAYIIRKITTELGYPVITIHDSIGIDILSVEKFERIGISVMQHVFDLDPFSLNKQSEIYLKIEGNMIFL